MKPFLLIAGEGYYPAGGTADWIACFETEEQAESQVEKITQGKITTYRVQNNADFDWYEIVDLRVWMNA